ncbi:MAG: hypothetical protein ABIW86_08265 [Flavobacterium sp.]
MKAAETFQKVAEQAVSNKIDLTLSYLKENLNKIKDSGMPYKQKQELLAHYKPSMDWLLGQKNAGGLSQEQISEFYVVYPLYTHLVQVREDI